MGAFYLVFESDPVERARLSAVMEASLREQGFGDGERVDAGAVAAGFHGKLSGDPPQFHRDAQGRFAALCGTALFDGSVGVEAARKLAALGAEQAADFSKLIGNFCVLHGDTDRACLFLDPLGVYKVYMTPDRRLFSSSFLALARALGSITPDAQGVYEYVHQEATYGDTTVAREIRQADGTGRYEFGDAVRFVPWRDDWSPQRLDGDVKVHLDACLERLRCIYTALSSSFADRVDTALSGGYDSRLTLALLREQGVQPYVHVYGAAQSMDVRVARAVADGEGFDLHHVDKSHFPASDPQDFDRVVRGNFLAFDGWPTAGIFDGGADLATRFERAAGGRLMLNGGGGEIFRNFFYLPDRPFTTREVVWSFYSRYAPHWCTAAFSESAYVDTLARKLGAVAGGDGERLSRAQVEYLFPAFRCGFWMGRNSSINARIGWALTPFIDRDLVRLAARVPLRLKNHGRFEAALIRAVSPALAAYASDYGHAFDRDPPLASVLKDYTTLLRPPRLRRLTYRMRFRKPQPRTGSLSDDMLGQVLDVTMPTLSEFFHVDRVNDPAAYTRIATLEYLFANIGG